MHKYSGFVHCNWSNCWLVKLGPRDQIDDFYTYSRMDLWKVHDKFGNMFCLTGQEFSCFLIEEQYVH